MTQKIRNLNEEVPWGVRGCYKDIAMYSFRLVTTLDRKPSTVCLRANPPNINNSAGAKRFSTTTIGGALAFTSGKKERRSNINDHNYRSDH